MKLLANRAMKRVCALFLTVVAALGVFGMHTPTSKVSAQGATYELVTDVDSLKTGDQVVLACSAKSAVMGDISTTSTKYGLSVTSGVAFSGNTITGLPADAKVLTITEETTGYSFKRDDGKYIAWKSGNSLITSDSMYAWNISIEKDGENAGTAKITSVATSTRYIQYNAGSPRFACYEKDQTAVQLYREVAADPTVHNHSYDIEHSEITLPAGCETVGERTYTCTNADGLNVGCTETDVEEIKATGHSYDADGVCTVCGNEQVVFSKLTDVAALTHGSKIIIVAKGKNMAMGAQSGTYRSNVAATVENDQVVDPTADVKEITVEKDGNYFYFNTDEGYLALNSNAKALHTVTEKGNFAKWTVEFNAEDGSAAIASVEFTARKLQYNASSPRFACYDTTQGAIEIYSRKLNAEEQAALAIELAVNEFKESVMEASFYLGYNENNELNKDLVRLRFGTTMTKEAYDAITELGGTFGIKMENAADNARKDLACTPAAYNDGYTFAGVVRMAEDFWATEVTATAYVNFGGTKYYLTEITFSVNSLAQDYITNGTDNEVLQILKGQAA